MSHPPLPAERHSFLPWALFPFKAPSSSAPIRPCQAGGGPLQPNRGSTSMEPRRVDCPQRTASSRCAIGIPSRVAPLCRAEARCRGAAGGPKPSPTAAPFQRDRGTPDGASWCPPSTEAEEGCRDGAREVCPETEVVKNAGLRCRRHAGCHPRVTPVVKVAPQGDSLTFMGFLTSKSAPRSVLLGRAPGSARWNVPAEV